MNSPGLQGAGGFVNLPRHPSQLYEAFGEGLILWLVLWFIVRKRKKFKGQIIAAYFIGYGAIRFFIEYFRTPDKGMDFPVMFTPVSSTSQLEIYPFNFTTGQLLCACMIAGGVLLHFFLKRRAGKNASALSENAGSIAEPPDGPDRIS
jgi:phosphatidylglycerol:prolipoprotein diacylglycerol transferase